MLLFATLPTFGNVVYASSVPSEVRTLTQTPLYSQNNIKSEIVKNSQNQDVILEENTILTVDTTFLDTMFYKVKIYNIVDNAQENDFAFVLIAQTLNSVIISPEQKLNANAIISKDNSPIYNYDSNAKIYSQTEKNLNKDTPVRILDGYDSNKTYTYISYQNENGEIIYCYVLTSTLSVEGINYSVIVAISILIACVSLILIIFGLKGKKKHKNKNKNG